MAYTTIDDPSAYFQTTLYTGNASSNKAITNDGNSDLQPDWVWIKERSSTSSHFANDSVRGAGKNLYTDLAGAEGTNTALFTSFNSDGFTVGNTNQGNQNNETYVAWQWKAGTSFSNDASSTSVGSIDSAGSVNTDAGFSIINVVKANTTAHTVAHGLGAVPQMIIGKNLADGLRWIVYHQAIGNTHALYLNEDFAKTDSVTFWNDTTPTSSVFSLGTDNSWNGTSIFYCFAEKKGYSKFSSYVGSGSAPGTFSYLGFKPAFLLIKEDGEDGWGMYDNKRNFKVGNTTSLLLQANDNGAESNAAANQIDFLSNGFVVSASGTQGNFINESGKTYIYMAFAENPLVTSTGIPTTAR